MDREGWGELQRKQGLGENHTKWGPVTMSWHFTMFWMEESPQLGRISVNILNKQSGTADKGWSSSWGVGQAINNSSPQEINTFNSYTATRN
jgi:hypothetical protein